MPDVTCILASVLATKVSWVVPFDVVDASELGPGDWSSQLHWVLRAPGGDHRHRQFLVETDSSDRWLSIWLPAEEDCWWAR